MEIIEKSVRPVRLSITLDPATLVDRGFKPEAAKAIPILARQGEVSPRDIAMLLRPETVRNRVMLREAIEWFTVLLQGADAIIIGKGNRKVSNPPVQPAKSEEEKEKARQARAEKRDQKHKMVRGLEGPPTEQNLMSESLLGAVVLNDEDVIVPYLREMARYPLLSHEEVLELSRRVRQWKDLESRNKLVRHNLRFVVHIARKFLGRGLDFADVVQEGNLGLIRAASGYDESKETKFTTYAWWWIRQSIFRGIMDYGNVVRRPAHFHEKKFRLLRAQREMERTHGRTPTPLELAEALDVPLDEVEALLALLNEIPISLDEEVGSEDGEGKPRHEFQEDTTSLDPHTILEAKLELQKSCFLLRRFLETLTILEQAKPRIKRNLDIFRMRYGLDGSFEMKTLDQVGVDVGITRERVRQICEKVLQELHAHGINADTRWIAREIDRVRELEVLVGEPAEL